MQETLLASKYFSPQGTISLTDDTETINLGNCSKFTIRGNKFILKLQDFCTYNLAKIFDSAIEEKMYSLSDRYSVRDVPFNTFNIRLTDKKWKLALAGINTSNNNLPFQVHCTVQFKQIEELNLIDDTFSSLILTGVFENLEYADVKFDSHALKSADNDKVVKFKNNLLNKSVKVIDLVKVNADLFKVSSLGCIYNRRDIVKISKKPNTASQKDKTLIDFINFSIEVAEPFEQVVRFFERYEDEQKMVKTINENAKEILDFLQGMKDDKFL